MLLPRGNVDHRPWAYIGSPRWRDDGRPPGLDDVDLVLVMRDLGVVPTGGNGISPDAQMSAATVLDPSSSHGVIRALATGIKAGFWARRALHNAESSRRIANAYGRWVSRWFEHDVRRLQTAYSMSR